MAISEKVIRKVLNIVLMAEELQKAQECSRPVDLDCLSKTIERIIEIMRDPAKLEEEYFYFFQDPDISDDDEEEDGDKIDYKKLCDFLIEDYCDAYGANEAINFLLFTRDLSVDNLVELGFHLDDINKVIKEDEEREGEDDEDEAEEKED